MIYDWYKLFSLTDYLATGLVARTLLVQLESRGQVTFQIFRGINVCIQYEDIFMRILEDKNPNTQSNYAVYTDENNFVWFGFGIEQ